MIALTLKQAAAAIREQEALVLIFLHEAQAHGAQVTGRSDGSLRAGGAVIHPHKDAVRDLIILGAVRDLGDRVLRLTVVGRALRLALPEHPWATLAVSEAFNGTR